MENVSKTLYIPLSSKAFVSRKGVILHDPDAERIWDECAIPLGKRSESKWLAYFLAMRARVYDDWTRSMLAANPGATVLHIGCGLDSRAKRVDSDAEWYDVDLAPVIQERKLHFSESENYHMIEGDAAVPTWLSRIPMSDEAIVILEGIAMYLEPDSLKALFTNLGAHFKKCHVLVDVYTPFGAKASNLRNPITEVGNMQVFGTDNPHELIANDAMRFLGERTMTPAELVDELSGLEHLIFKTMYSSNAARKAYRMYEYELAEQS